MSAEHTPHSTPGANQVLLRDLLEVMQACHDNTCADCKADLVTALKAFSYLEEQLETLRHALNEGIAILDVGNDYHVMLLRDMDGWAERTKPLLAASSPAKRPT